MRFLAQAEVFDHFPGMHVAVVVAQGLDNAAPRASVTALWRAAWADAAGAAVYGNAQSHPRVRPWRDRFQALGISGKEFPSSIEALLRRALKGGESFQINPLVDWYNAVSLRHVVPVGAFDLDQIAGPMELRVTHAGDRFEALDAADGEAIAVSPGEVAYAAGDTILTRHFVWRQARRGLIAPSTRSALVVSEVMGEIGVEVAAAVLDDLRRGLAEHFGIDAIGWLVSAERPVVSW